MKWLILILFLAAFGSIVTGFLTEEPYSQKLIGFGVAGLFIVVFPLFTYYRWKDRSVKDYMLTKENLDKMRDFRDNKKA
ncbi:MAG: hypothetical protein KJO49_10960 [Bacteroidia bacterium]|nr:hypothetical protein [Bacteroidia bacterium]NNF81575.1 hypothetical protein [Flavobacteriaceae bacterium]NNK70328.1 hypothetical protein [Flavobacteriaceae bacterium]NNL81391.1 hypothetical protein [Flavobacteriaceae bacterium]